MGHKLKYELILRIINLEYSFRIQDDIRRALHYTNQLLELEPDHPRAVGNKWYYEEALGDDGVVDDALNRRRGKQNTSCNIHKWYFIDSQF